MTRWAGRGPPNEQGPSDRATSDPTPRSQPHPDLVARTVADLMWADDRASQALGMELLEVKAGYARMRMAIRRDMTNGHGMCHGGYTFLLADSTFAFACNSHNQRTVAASAEIHFLASAQEGDVLLAEGVEQHLAGRSGLYDVRVTDQNGRPIAMFRGKSATIRGRFIEDPELEHLPNGSRERDR